MALNYIVNMFLVSENILFCLQNQHADKAVNNVLQKCTKGNNTMKDPLRDKVSKYVVFSCPNAGKYRLEKTPYLDSLHAVTIGNER